MNTEDTKDHWCGPSWSKTRQRRWQYDYAAMARIGRLP